MVNDWNKLTEDAGCVPVVLCLHGSNGILDDFVAGLPVEHTLDVFDPDGLGSIGVRETVVTPREGARMLAEKLDSDKYNYTERQEALRCLYPRIQFEQDEERVNDTASLLQMCYDAALPGISEIDCSLDDEINLFEDVYTPTTSYRINYSRFARPAHPS